MHLMDTFSCSIPNHENAFPDQCLVSLSVRTHAGCPQTHQSACCALGRCAGYMQICPFPLQNLAARLMSVLCMQHFGTHVSAESEQQGPESGVCLLAGYTCSGDAWDWHTTWRSN